MEPKTLKFKEAVYLGLILLLPFFFYSDLLHYPYVSFDDSIHIYRNDIYSPFSWKKIGAVWVHLKNGLYVPVAYTIWGLFITMMGLTQAPLELSASSFHGLNLVIHAANGVIVFFLIRRMLRISLAAFIGSLIFLVHPLQVESFAWISSFDGLLATFFGLLACMFWYQYLSQSAEVSYLGFLFFASLSLLSKPSAVSWPFIFLSLAWYQNSKKIWPVFVRLLPVFGLAVLIIVLTRLGQPEHQLRFVTPYMQRPLVAADSLVFYLTKTFIPVDLTVNYGRTPDLVLKSPWALLKLGFLISLLYIFFRVKLARIYRLGIFIFIGALIPNLGLIPFNFQKYSSVADRYAYVAVLGLAFCIAKISSDSSKFLRPFCGFLLVAIFSLQSMQQLKFWKSDTLLVYKMADAAPNFFHHSNLAQMLWIEMEGKSPLPMLAPQPLSIPMTQNQLLGRIAEIKFHFQEALRFEPGDIGTQVQLYQFMSVYGDSSLKGSWMSELKRLETKVYKDSTAGLTH